MSKSKYLRAGWIAIASAAIFPFLFILGFIENIVKIKAFGFTGPHLGPSDALGILHTVLSIYVLFMLRRFLIERFEFHGVDKLIMISIWWLATFQFLGMVLKGMVMLLWPVPEAVYAILFGSFLVVAILVIGVVDILIAVQLLRIKESLNGLLLAFTFITLIAGICEVSLIFAALALLLVPVTSVILGVLFIREKEQVVEFV